jgi:ferredoxin/flavodoxin---NADP+ reductase
MSEEADAVTEQSSRMCDIVIVGAGPVGIFAAYYAGFRGLRTLVIDSLEQPGGQISAMYPAKPIFDVAGFPNVLGRDLVAQLLAQAGQFGTRYLLGTTVADLTPLPVNGERPWFQLVTADGHTIMARSVLIAGGIGRFQPRPHRACTPFEGRGVEYYVQDLESYRDRDVVIIGGGDSAVDWALTLLPTARSVTLVHRRSTFRAHAHSVSTMMSSSVNVVTDAEVVAVRGGECLESVVVRAGGEDREIKCQRLIPAMGFTAAMGPILGWGLEIEDRRHIRVDSRMATSLPGVFAAGDITAYPGKARLIAVGFGEAATAVNNAAHYINPGAEIFPGHSSESDGRQLTNTGTETI